MMKQSIKKRLTISALLALCAYTMQASESSDSIDVYENHVVNDLTVIQGHTLLTIRNVTVSGTGYLKASSPEGISVTAPVIVEQGGVLELNGGMQYGIRYTYDSTGNRIRREKNSPY